QVIDGGHWVGDHGLICESCFNPSKQCFACAKQLSDKTLLRLPDHRKLCSGCATTAVHSIGKNDITQMEIIFKNLGCKIQRPTSFAVVDYSKLQKTFVKPDSTCLGHCVFHYAEIGKIKILKHHSIEILYGLPHSMFLGVLAHEMFHAWLIELFWQREILSIDDQDWLAESIACSVLKDRVGAEFWYNRARHSRDCLQAQPRLVESLRDKSGSEIVSFMRTFK
ncbi:protein DA1, partial [Candidatus Falkowbacteria bacterium]|nr:protein DA1 [Candidatus Falkowbacteria bacterium]